MGKSSSTWLLMIPNLTYPSIIFYPTDTTQALPNRTLLPPSDTPVPHLLTHLHRPHNLLRRNFLRRVLCNSGQLGPT